MLNLRYITTTKKYEHENQSNTYSNGTDIGDDIAHLVQPDAQRDAHRRIQNIVHHHRPQDATRRDRNLEPGNGRAQKIHPARPQSRRHNARDHQRRHHKRHVGSIRRIRRGRRSNGAQARQGKQVHSLHENQRDFWQRIHIH